MGIAGTNENTALGALTSMSKVSPALDLDSIFADVDRYLGSLS